ncbi:hypothetical protein [Agarivorans sp. Z349TD_8]|uniref:hypothetical protein n=1 Tax=Agarivorans sp. Z349TD_8 TaxID=3421434 RepID=UPI003D7CB255
MTALMFGRDLGLADSSLKNLAGQFNKRGQCQIKATMLKLNLLTKAKVWIESVDNGLTVNVPTKITRQPSQLATTIRVRARVFILRAV